MDQSPVNEALKLPENPRRLTSAKLADILRDSAVAAAGRTIVVLVLGSVALSLAGAVFREMIPSTPPLSSPTSHWRPFISQWSPLTQNGFLLVFSLCFMLLASVRLARYSDHHQTRTVAAWMLRHGRKVSRHWFSFVVGNVFGAWISAIVISCVPSFSWTHWLWSELVGTAASGFNRIAEALFGAGGAGTMQAFASWYGENQLKFTFWFLYLAAMGDDLGVPNFKTLGRWMWRRTRKRISRIEAG